MKVRASVRKICSKCQLIWRGKRLSVVCVNARHKQKQG